MKKHIISALLSLTLSPAVLAAEHQLSNNNIALSYDESSGILSVMDRHSGVKLTPLEPFFLTLPDESVLHAADFSHRLVNNSDDTLAIEYRRPDFIVNMTLHTLNGRYASLDYRIAAVDKPRNLAKITFFPTKRQSQAPFVEGAINSSPLIADSFFILPEKPIVNTYAYETATNLNVELQTPIHPATPVSYKTYFGTFPDISQLRRSVNQFVESVRPRPYKPYLHYNSWMDIGFFTTYTEQDVLQRIDEWNTAFIHGRDIKLDAFLLDDGWDDRTGRWLFGPAFRHGFAKVRTKAESVDSSIGLWLSPFGGYNKPREIRVSHAKEYGFETVDGKLALSGANYFKNFNQQIINLIKTEHVTSFKLDGMGNATSHIKGSPYASDFDASIALISNMRAANKNQFINLSTGTNASPSWLFYADSIWRQGDDINLYGKGSAVQQWITYRDAETYRSIVRKGPLFPLNSLMYHGIVSAEHAYFGLEKVQSDDDFADQAWSYFATGTQLQELYITPSLLNDKKWDTLAQAVRWAQANADIMVDTHWVGGDPTLLEVYGWASWRADKAVLALRNPSDKPQQFYLDLRKAFEVPQDETASFTLKPVYGSNSTLPASMTAPQVITLQPLETLVLDATPQH